jgi:hypothetical protein
MADINKVGPARRNHRRETGKRAGGFMAETLNDIHYEVFDTLLSFDDEMCVETLPRVECGY